MRGRAQVHTLHMLTWPPRSRSISSWLAPSMRTAVRKISSSSISACVLSSTMGNWMAWCEDSGMPKGWRVCACRMLDVMQYWAAPRDEAA